MPCYSPLTGYYSREVGASGKRGITFQRSASFSGVPLRLPCGQCIGCRLERSRQWAMRCMHEKRLHRDNVFVTLTYRTMPDDRSLSVRDLQLFMKRLRKEKGNGIRFFACGEYGPQNGRPHYHAILFNCRFDDMVRFKPNKAGDDLFTSRSLERIWSHGFCTLGEVTFKSCAYVARYICDKITGEAAKEWYTWIDSDGEVHTVLPEFTNMSRRPGIGSGYYDRFGAAVRAHDTVVINGREVAPPRFYDTRTERIDPEKLVRIKEKRRRKAMKRREDNTPDRRRVRERVALLNLQANRKDQI